MSNDRQSLSPTNVPAGVEVLLPIAARWGISDDVLRAEQVDAANRSELKALVEAVDSVDDDALYGWLEGPESQSAAPSAEYLAVTCLTMAADLARLKFAEEL